MNSADIEKIIKSLIDTFVISGNISLDLRNKGLKKEIKDDNTPVTNGDIEVNNLLTKKIKNLTPNIKIVSEETVTNKDSKNLKDFWLIDPIDGTSDYINGRDEFTINAALILNKKPVAGIINAPDKKRLFYTWGSSNSYEINNGTKEKFRPNSFKKGNIKDLKGKVLGVHDGIINYTIGQRKGIKVSGKVPLYVLKIDAEKNEIFVGPKKYLLKKEIKLKNFNIMCQNKKDFEEEIFVKIRSTGKLLKAKVKLKKINTTVTLLEDEYGISPGQACVFYAKNDIGHKVLGGGWISN